MLLSEVEREVAERKHIAEMPAERGNERREECNHEEQQARYSRDMPNLRRQDVHDRQEVENFSLFVRVMTGGSVPKEPHSAGGKTRFSQTRR